MFAVGSGGELWAYREPLPDSRDAADFPVPDGRFYTQTSAAADTGFTVTDEDGIPFYSTFRSFPLQIIGYPISQRFSYRGLPTQLFEHAALQWQPGGGVFFLNLLDDLHDAGQDAQLDASKDIPPPLDSSADAGLTWDQVVARHLALLDRDPQLKAAYLQDPRWLDLYGLPVGYRDHPLMNVVRGQRAALTWWRMDVPGFRGSDIPVEYGVDLAIKAGFFPAEALVPQPPPAP